MDISGNDLELNNEDIESEDYESEDIESDDIESAVTESDVSGNDFESSFYPEYESGESYVTEPSQIVTADSVDYSNYFENLQTIGIFIAALLVAQGLIIAFCMGFKK